MRSGNGGIWLFHRNLEGACRRSFLAHGPGGDSVTGHGNDAVFTYQNHTQDPGLTLKHIDFKSGLGLDALPIHGREAFDASLVKDGRLRDFASRLDNDAACSVAADGGSNGGSGSGIMSGERKPWKYKNEAVKRVESVSHEGCVRI